MKAFLLKRQEEKRRALTGGPQHCHPEMYIESLSSVLFLKLNVPLGHLPFIWGTFLYFYFFTLATFNLFTWTPLLFNFIVLSIPLQVFHTILLHCSL